MKVPVGEKPISPAPILTPVKASTPAPAQTKLAPPSATKDAPVVVEAAKENAPANGASSATIEKTVDTKKKKKKAKKQTPLSPNTTAMLHEGLAVNKGKKGLR